MNKWFNVGKVVNTHGVKGEVRVISITDFKEERYKKGNKLFLFNGENSPIELIVASHRQHKSFDLLSFEGYGSLNDVEFMKGMTLKVPESQLGELPEGEYYFYEIIGCTVLTTVGEQLGKVTEVLTPGANDVWVVKTSENQEVYIPYIDQVVKEVNVKEKVITIELMDGLLP